MIDHNAKTIKKAHETHFGDHTAAYSILESATTIIQNNLAERKEIFNKFVATWTKSQIPKGYSTATKKYVEEIELVDEFEMNEILNNVELIESLRKGSNNVKQKRGRFV